VAAHGADVSWLFYTFCGRFPCVANGVTTPALALLPFGYDVRQAVRDLAAG